MRRPRPGHDALIIGGGIAGLSCALHAARLGLRVACFEASPLFGGAVANVGTIEGYPAGRQVSGAELASDLVEACRGLGVEIVNEAATSLAPEGAAKSLVAGGKEYAARQLVLATGARLRRLGVPGEQALAGRGVSQCAFCDAGFFRDLPVAVVGGGDAAMQEALHLADTCSSVTVIVRGTSLRAKRSYARRASANPKFSFRWNTRVDAVLGSDHVEGVRVADLREGQQDEIACNGVFVFIGSDPDTALLPAAIERTPEGHVVTGVDLQTSLPGVFAIGAVRAGYGGQLAQAVADGIAAAQALS